MIQRLSAFLFILAFPFVISAQQPMVCGFEEDEAFIENLKQLKDWVAEGNLNTRDNTVKYVPVKFHIITKTDGTGGANELDLFTALCFVNQAYADQNIQFYIYGGFNYIKNNTAWNDPGDATLVLQGNKVNKAMNVYIGENPVGGSGLGTTLGYYNPGGDWIVMRKNNLKGSDPTWAHEVGHYFNLAHPFRGWDCTFWQDTLHGNPVNITTAPCPQFAGLPIELVNGSNCAIAGDLLCDTPADYNLGFTWNNSCNYTGPCKDSNGDPLKPMEDNFMGYFNGCAQYKFSAQQKNIIAARLTQRIALETVTTPFPAIEGTTTLVQPANSSTTPAYNNVAFEWEPVPGANQYLLEIDITTGFNLLPVRMIVWGTYKVVQGLQSNKLYYWRVRPFNNYYTCAPVSTRWSFTTGTTTGTVEPPYVTNWSVRPNPVSTGESLTLEINTAEAFEANIALRSLSGQTLQTMQTSFAAGQSALQIPTNGLAAGVYLVTVQSAGGVINQRVVITR